ncbi:MAG TPA: hypothetical protein VK919_02765 [Solirubrobacterales bacterium]|nr:hypothetical protein [Solirubrobacterales bacterium]
MAPKPHRVLLDRVSGYADEAVAYLRRRHHTRRPFARVDVAGGHGASHSADDERGRELFRAAAEVIETARERR